MTVIESPDERILSKGRNYLCSWPTIWDRIFPELSNLWNTEPKGLPPPPMALTLEGWNYSSSSQRGERWRETLKWANRHGVDPDILRLDESEKHRG
jgi:hypothetical protein